ncbi:transglycosylase SLT domain-containing protein [Nocardia sp. NPDC051463]|uniref:transglycosylase SLT domain-containing protein n=1 Tax=Nocardia sp. NPDC051463 TaxID=3154845 RepID=UPI003419ED46
MASTKKQDPLEPEVEADTEGLEEKPGDARTSVTTADEPRRPVKSAARGSPARLPPMAPVGASAASMPPATAARGPITPLIAESPTAGTGSASIARPDALAWSGAATPMAAAALGALATIAAHYGDDTPSADTGQSYSPPVLGTETTASVAGVGELGSQYAADSHNRSQRINTVQSLNAELGKILEGAADSTTQGRAAIAAIIADVNTALVALGGISDVTVARNFLLATLTNAVQRAGSVLAQGQVAAATTADRVSKLTDRYLQDTRPTRPSRPRRPRRASHPDSRAASGGPPRTRPAGQQGQWINEALQILRAQGYDTRQIDPADIAAIIQHESGGNPNAINLWDSNAAAGIPSKGLMQTIDPTFNSYALPGHRDIWNPVDNIIAGVRYSIDRYGSVSNVPGIVQMRGGGSYVGY